MTGSGQAPASRRKSPSRGGASGGSCTPTRRPANSPVASAAITPSVVGVSARTPGFSPISRSARAGFGPRVIVRIRPSASRKPGSIPARSAIPRNRRNPSPVISTRSSNGAAIARRSQASTGAGSGASTIATSGQRRVSAPCSSSIRPSRSSSRCSSSAMHRPAKGRSSSGRSSAMGSGAVIGQDRAS